LSKGFQNLPTCMVMPVVSRDQSIFRKVKRGNLLSNDLQDVSGVLSHSHCVDVDMENFGHFEQKVFQIRPQLNVGCLSWRIEFSNWCLINHSLLVNLPKIGL
jgi:hypothetical protein